MDTITETIIEKTINDNIVTYEKQVCSKINLINKLYQIKNHKGNKNIQIFNHLKEINLNDSDIELKNIYINLLSIEKIKKKLLKYELANSHKLATTYSQEYELANSHKLPTIYSQEHELSHTDVLNNQRNNSNIKNNMSLSDFTKLTYYYLNRYTKKAGGFYFDDNSWIIINKHKDNHVKFINTICKSGYKKENTIVFLNNLIVKIQNMVNNIGIMWYTKKRGDIIKVIIIGKLVAN